MRALILRRVGCWKAAPAGPIIVGRVQSRRRACGCRFPAPQRPSAPASSIPTIRRDGQNADRALPCRRQHLPIVLCPNGQLLRNPERERARPLPRPGAADRRRQSSTTWPSSAPGRPGWPRRSMRRPKACRPSCSIAAPSAGRPAPPRGSRTTLGFPTGITGHGADGARLQPGAEIRRRRWRSPTRPWLRALRTTAIRLDARRRRAACVPAPW